MRQVKVPLADRSYHIKIGRDLVDRLGRECASLGLGKRCAVVTDSNVAPLHAARVLQSLKQAGFDPIQATIPAGEKSKSLAQVDAVYNQLASQRLERKSFVVALGGGVVGDLAGFVAATYLRGVAFVQVPTTLLAQVDSSVGGKVGVNLKSGKNLVGAFYQPRLVICDLATLETLPEREFLSGLAEVIKYGIIYDKAFFKRLERDMEAILARDGAALERIVARSCQIKADVVGQDETESGLRAILNFGHTIGHALEAVSKYGKFLHGEAISVGQVAAARLSSALLGLPESETARIRNLFLKSGLPIGVRTTGAQREKLTAAMRLDKKVSGGEIRFVLAKNIGAVVWGQSVPQAAIATVLDAAASEPGAGPL